MSDHSNYLGNMILNWIKGTAFASAPSTVYGALFNGDPQSSGSEVTSTIRTAGRLALNSLLGTVASKALANSSIVDFGSAAGGATVTHFAIYDAATSGNLLVSGTITGEPISVGAGTDFSFPIGNLTLSE